MAEIIAGVVVFLIVIVAIINIDLDGAREYLKNLRKWLKGNNMNCSRKAYRKSRHRKSAERALKRLQKDLPGFYVHRVAN